MSTNQTQITKDCREKEYIGRTLAKQIINYLTPNYNIIYEDHTDEDTTDLDLSGFTEDNKLKFIARVEVKKRNKYKWGNFQTVPLELIKYNALTNYSGNTRYMMIWEDYNNNYVVQFFNPKQREIKDLPIVRELYRKNNTTDEKRLKEVKHLPIDFAKIFTIPKNKLTQNIT